VHRSHVEDYCRAPRGKLTTRCHDPLLDNIEAEFGIRAIKDLKQVPKVDAVILTVAHKAFQKISLDELKGIMNTNPILIDVPGFFDNEEAAEAGLYYQTL